MKPLILASTPCPPISAGDSMVKPKKRTRRITDSPVLTAVYLRELNREPRTRRPRTPTPDELRIVWDRIREEPAYVKPDGETAGYETSGHCPHTLGQYLSEALKRK